MSFTISRRTSADMSSPLAASDQALPLGEPTPPSSQPLGSFGRAALLTIGTNGLLALFGFATGVLAARLLGPKGRGELAAIQTLPSFIGSLAMLGMGEAVVYYCAREPQQAGRQIASAVTLALMACVPFLTVGYLGMPLFLSAQSAGVVAAARWYLLIGPLYALAVVPMSSLRGRSDFAPWNLLRLTPAFALLGSLVLAWVIRALYADFVAVVYLASNALLALPLTFYLVGRTTRGPFRPDTSRWRPLFRFGLPSALTIVPQTLNLRFDQMLMAGLLPPAMLGLYAVGVAWSGAVTPLLSAFAVVLFPAVASKADRQQRGQTFTRTIRLGAPLALLLALGLAATTPLLLPLVFGLAFAAATRPAIVLVFAAAIFGLNLMLEEGLRGLGSPKSVMWSEFGGLIVTVLSLLCLLGPMGIMGAAVSSLLGYATVTLFLLRFARRLTGYSFAAMLIPGGEEIRRGWIQIRRLVNV